MSNSSSSWFNERGQLILLLAGVGGLLFIMYLLQDLINPLGYGLIVAIVLYPIRQQPVARALLYATVFSSGLWLFYDSGHLLIPFILAYILAFIFDPLVDRLTKKNIPRWLVATAFTLIGLTGLTLIGIYGLPALAGQLVRLGRLSLDATQNTYQWLDQTGLFSLMNRMGLTDPMLKTGVSDHIHLFLTHFYDQVTNLSSSFVTGFGSVLTIVFFIILTPFLLFFMIRDYDKIGRFVRTLITPKGVKDTYTRDISRIVGAYIRGQFIVVVISSINLSIGFTIFGVPYAVVLGLFAGITNFIPTFGLWLSITVCTIVASTVGQPWYAYLPGIYIVFAVEKVLETGWIVPRVVGKHVGLHPLLVMLSLLIFGFMFGFLGLLIAVPSVALLSVFYEQYRKTNKISFMGGAELDHFFESFGKEEENDNKKETSDVP